MLRMTSNLFIIKRNISTKQKVEGINLKNNTCYCLISMQINNSIM